MRKIALFLVVMVALYSLFVEPHWFRITHQTIDLKNLKNPLQILLLSDFQLKGPIGYRERWILQRIPQWKFDIICITGDLFDTVEGAQPGADFLQALSHYAPTYVVLGNWELWSKVNILSYKDQLSRRGIYLLVNESRLFNWKGQPISIIGVDDPSEKMDDLPLAMAHVNPVSVKILLTHAPTIFPDAAARGIDLALAGHTHGGQVRLPFVGPLWLPRGCRPFVYGLYTQRDSKMFVTAGVGMSVLPIRFLCRPEVALLRVG